MTTTKTKQAAAITRALRPLSPNGRLTTTTTDLGWRVTTTHLLAKQLADADDGYLIVKRRLAPVLGREPRDVGVAISARRRTIHVV